MIKIFLLSLLVLSFNSQTCEQCAEDYSSDDTPVCGRDGRTYLSECFASCNRVRVWFEGRCARHNCPQLYYPVCTRSGRTYMNECEANFYEEQVVRPGFCRERPQPNNLDSNMGPYYLVTLKADRINDDFMWP